MNIKDIIIATDILVRSEFKSVWIYNVIDVKEQLTIRPITLTHNVVSFFFLGSLIEK